MAEKWQTEQPEAVAQASAWAALVMANKGWSDADIKQLYSCLDEADKATKAGRLEAFAEYLGAGDKSENAIQFWKLLASLLLAKSPDPEPEGWKDLYLVAATAAGASQTAAEEIWLNSVSGLATGTIVDTAKDVKAAGATVGNVANAAADTTKSANKSGLIYLILLGLGIKLLSG